MLLFQAKHLQFVSGVDVFSYWFATYTWDFLNYLVPALGILILFAAFQVDSYKDELGTVFLMLVSRLKSPSHAGLLLNWNVIEVEKGNKKFKLFIFL